MNKEDLAVENTKQVDELFEDIEVVGPGLMLSEARKKLSLTEDEVSSRLNFRRNLVNEIEQDIFDPLLPATFNRGYLRNYAKLVEIDIDEVLSAYDMLGVAEVQRSEMQSFSNLTVKQAEHSRLMWISYLIVALLFGMMVLWWIQEPKLPVNLFDDSKQEQPINNNISVIADVNEGQKSVEAPKPPKEVTIVADEIIKPVGHLEKDIASVIAEQSIDTVNDNQLVAIVKQETQVEPEIPVEFETKAEKTPGISTVVFTFSGDCWVNIYDATGERIAWGVKKLGYVMTVTGKPPLKVTLGRPELAAIAFNGKQVDMSSFNAGNIAKFSLPLISQ